MTKLLSDLLGARGPGFRQALMQLERASGLPSADIRLSTDILHSTREFIRNIGLDPHDTHAEELYAVLQQRLRHDEQALLTALGVSAQLSNQEVLSKVQKKTTQMLKGTEVFAMKHTIMKRLIKANPPRQAMKALGYRSVDSLIKHEHPALILAAAYISEEPSWHQKRKELYASLSSVDFEVISLRVLHPANARWSAFAIKHMSSMRHNTMAFTELGTVVMLPVSQTEHIKGLSIISMILVFRAANDIRAASSCLKLQQVRPDFGMTVAAVAGDGAFVAARLAGQPITWRLIHRYFSEIATYPAHLFEPHVQQDDLQWHHPEKMLAALVPSFTFWEQSHFLALVHQGKIVSLNVLDVALNYCNQIACSSGIVQNVQESIRHELHMRYMQEEHVARVISEQIGVTMAPVPIEV